MFDELHCFYPLPDGWLPKPTETFQTKSTPEQYLARYELRADGTLWRVWPLLAERYAYHGALTFYTSNIVGVRREGCLTRDGQPPWEAEYVALYDHGTLLRLEGSKRPNTSCPWLTAAAWAALQIQRLTAQEIRALSEAATDERQREGGGEPRREREHP